MSSERKSLNHEVFTSVGNAWMLCRSKTHRGHVYYFNTLTGETAWNLSDAEMEKARSRTQELAHQPYMNIQNCPEPKDPPNLSIRSTRTTHSITPSKIYNKQIINNQYSKSPVGINPFVSSQCSNCSPFTQLAPQTPTFNPHVWAIPQTHPIIFAPTTPSVVYQQQPSYSLHKAVEQNVPIQNPSVPLHKENHNWKNRTSFKYTKKNYNWSNRKVFQKQNNKWRVEQTSNETSQDLRQVLAEKRKRHNSCVSPNENESLDTKNINFVKQNSTQTEECVSSSQDIQDEIYPSDIDEEWLEENTHYQGVKPLINVAPLTALARENDRNDCWYIVVDTSVLLSNLDFLNVLVNSDENCILMTPESTMEELKLTIETGSSDQKKRSRRALSFLSQQITSGSAFLGEDEYADPDLGNHEALICCLTLSDQHNHAIMVSNNPDVLHYRDNVSFPIFSIFDLKEMLVSKEPEPEEESPDLVQNPIPEIKAQETEDIYEDIPLTVTIKNDLKEDFTIENPDNSGEKHSAMEKVSTAVQTDIDDVVITLCSKWYTPPPGKKKSVSEATTSATNDKNTSAKVQPTKSALSPIINSTLSSTSEYVKAFASKKREVRLKRNLLNQRKDNDTDNSETKQKKQFKWHRRRNKSIIETVTKSQTPNDDQKNHNHNENAETDKPGHQDCDFDQQSLSKSVFSGSPLKQNGNFSFGSDVSNNETSYTFVPRRFVDDSTVVEELSTTNPASIADSGSVGTSLKCFPTYNYESGNKHVMFEITSQFMDDHLRRKSDEWVSRFTQIMEDVLTEILQQDPVYEDSRMTPPWTMHEAVECMKRKYCKNADVLDACTQLSNLLAKIIDSKGIITQNITPTNFMEMYSYGVYLIDTLLSTNYCEDLQIAAESLSILLSDIQDPATDTAQNESFTENMNDLSINLTEPPCSPVSTPQNNTEEISVSTPKRSNNESTSKLSPSNSSLKKYYLRSKLAVKQKENENSCKDGQVAAKSDVESTFFTCLNLQKNISNAVKEDKESPDISAIHNKAKCVDNDLCQNEATENEKNVTENDNAIKTAETKIVRNFTQCFEFEQRIKNKDKECLDLDELDYGEDHIDTSPEYNEDDYEDQYFEDDNDILNGSYENGDSNCIDSSKMDMFKVFIGQLWCEIKDIFSTVHTFCVATIEWLRAPSQLTCSKIFKIKYQAQVAKTDIHNLREALLNIKLEDINAQDCNVQESFKKAGLNLVIDCAWTMDEEQFKKYRDIVSNITAQADILLQSINVILDTVGK